MAVFQITDSPPNARIVGLTALAGGGLVAPIFENVEGSTTQLGAVKFALFEINSAGQAEQVGSAFQLGLTLPPLFNLTLAPLNDGGFTAIMTKAIQRKGR